MSEIAVLDKLETLTPIVQRLESCVEELKAHEDLRVLEKAIVQNGDKPLVPWEQGRAMLGLD
jgi:hypothetical protein